MHKPQVSSPSDSDIVSPEPELLGFEGWKKTDTKCSPISPELKRLSVTVGIVFFASGDKVST
jgi:hypothetical protein